MSRRLFRSRTLARRSLPLTMSVVVLAFVAATVYSQRLLSNDAEALDIAGNSAPSIASLADARAELRALERIAARSDGHGLWPAHRRRLDAALVEYERTPMYPGEPELDAEARRQLARVDVAVQSGAPAQTTEAALDELDGAIFSLSELNRSHLLDAARMIGQGGRRRNLVAFTLDGIAIVIAFIATLLAARTVERHLRVMERRTRELEHLAIQVGHEIANPLAPIEVALHGAAARADEEPARAAVERAQRSLGRIHETIARLVAFAKAGVAHAGPPSRTPLGPALADAARAVGCTAAGGGDIHVAGDVAVALPEALLRELLADFLGGSAQPNTPLESVGVTLSSHDVRIAVARAAAADGADPFDPQLHIPGAAHPGIDLRLATVRRYVEGAGGTVGVRRGRRREELWIELPSA